MEDTKKFINRIRRKINDSDCPRLDLNLSTFSLMDAAKVLTMTSTYHFNKYPKGKLKCQVRDASTKTVLSNFNLKNLELVY
ncbi:MAG: hypothetical protein NC390_07555 [Fusobacterium sp.]|nr:hypothetical protein [Fusobacterium sp.]